MFDVSMPLISSPPHVPRIITGFELGYNPHRS